MNIAYIEIQNYRKLKSCRVEFSDKETIFVGANNSGKTSAMYALMFFLDKTRRKSLSTTDFTLSNWNDIDAIGQHWSQDGDDVCVDLNPESWVPFLPSVDVWLDVQEHEIYYVSHLIPRLDWRGGVLGVRLRLEPKNIEELFVDFSTSIKAARQTIADALQKETKQKLRLWPQSMRDFLDRRLHVHFAVRAYILDPSKLEDPEKGYAHPQLLPSESPALDREPFDSLFKIDIINAQRGFSDTHTLDGSSTATSTGGLSAQLRHYFSTHLNPSELPAFDDIEALEAIEAARTTFDITLRKSFEPAIGELEGLGYPGFSDPEIVLTSKINPIDGLDHVAAVQFNLLKTSSSDTSPLCLPETYNGLGYQNLVSMVFNLIRFRDEWMRKGKAGKKQEQSDNIIQPVHLVLIEEPEAHLHAQVQQVFIKKAYRVLRNHQALGVDKKFTTQLVVSTHSSHIAHESDFEHLRYFRRTPARTANEVPCATVVNLSTTFGRKDDTSKFVSRYLKTTHCDLFFADAAIVVEGPAERMLIPHFIRHKHPLLDSCYITILEIGGSHAHRLRPLIEQLGLPTLIITDIDSISDTTTKKVLPKRAKNYRSGNDTLKSWVPCMQTLDELLNATPEERISSDSLIRVAYQSPFTVQYRATEQEAIPYTFEDALVLTNTDVFMKLTNSTGLTKKMVESFSRDSFDEMCGDMFEALASGKKAEMALDLLYNENTETLEVPQYIAEGLNWLEESIRRKNVEFPTQSPDLSEGDK